MTDDDERWSFGIYVDPDSQPAKRADEIRASWVKSTHVWYLSATVTAIVAVWRGIAGDWSATIPYAVLAAFELMLPQFLRASLLIGERLGRLELLASWVKFRAEDEPDRRDAP